MLLTPVGLLGAVVRTTYVFCMRPMRWGTGSINQVVRTAFGVKHAVCAVTDADADWRALATSWPSYVDERNFPLVPRTSMTPR